MNEKILTWQDGLTPKSSIYDDIYFSTENGIEERRAVFLDGIDAPEVWRHKTSFTICELGFGTGLNFLNTVGLWLKSTDERQKLTYLATEKHMLSASDIMRAINWQELTGYRDDLLEQWGREEITLKDGRIKLRLLKGDSYEQLKQNNFQADAWYLDGFAPSKNPEMWSDDLIGEIARLSKPGTRIATFTAAGFVRRALERQGFKMDKRPGYGKKREMLHGQL